MINTYLIRIHSHYIVTIVSIALLTVVANIERATIGLIMNQNKNIKDTLARARAIHLAMHHGAISYEEAQELTKPLLEEVNRRMVEIAKKFNQRPRKLVFQDLGRTL